MKNLMIYISPTGSFDNPRKDLAANDAGPLAKVQIENSLKLGWKAKDIMLVTNFPFEYGAVKAIELKDVPFFERKPQASKINAIVQMFNEGLIKRGQLYWFHDLDALQLAPISESEIGNWFTGIALTDYGGKIKFGKDDRWSTGSMFFRLTAKDIFTQIKDVMYKKNIDEEEALGILTSNNPTIKSKVKKINNSYNFTGYNLETVYANAVKPIKVIHFHPNAARRRANITNSYTFFKGDNPLKTQFITDSLIKLLKYHSIV